MSRDYGLLMKGTAVASTKARIESLSLSTRVLELRGYEPHRRLEARVTDRTPDIEHFSPTDLITDKLRSFTNYQRYILVAILFLIFITAFSK